MNENLTFTEKMKLKFCNAKNWAQTKLHNGYNWAKDHPVETLSIIGGVATGASKAYKFAKLHEDKVHRERDFYDPRVGKTTRASRKLKSYELNEIERRYSRGESYQSILFDMGLWK